MNSIFPTVQWTANQVSDRFRDAVITARSLPPVRVQGYFNGWPSIIHQSGGTVDTDDYIRLRRFPPTGAAVEKMMETMRWIQVLEEIDRHIVWGYAKGIPRVVMAKRLGIGRTTLHRRHSGALQKIADHLNRRREIG